MRIDELRVALRTPGGEPASSRRSLTRPEAPLTRRRKGGPRSPKIRTGLRRGELLELRWGDLHLEAATPFVRVSRAPRQGGARAAAPTSTTGR